MPFDVAFSLKPHELMAWTIIIGEQNGGTWDWNLMQWKSDER